jgi:lysophospholipase L1-like esterase
MQVKGMVLAGYALALAYLTFRIRAKPTTQAVLLASLVLALLGGEVITRIINPAPEDPDFRQAAPYIMFAGQPNGVIESFDDLPLNALGYRDLPALPKPPDEYRIILLGGSTVFQGVPRSESIAGALEGQFAANGQPQVKVYNWGVYSVVTGQELATILFRAVDYSPDMLLVYSGANDLTEPYFFDPRPGYPFDFMAVEAGQRLLEGRWGLYDLYAVLLRPTSLGFALFQFEIEEQLTQRHTLAQSVEWGGEDWRAELAQGYGQNLGKMCQLSRAFGFRLVAVLQPMIFFKDRLAGQESALLGPQDYQDHTSQAYSLAQAELTRLGQTYVASDCLFEDGSLWLQDDTRELFTDPVHLNALGNQRIGQRLAVLLGGVLE